MTWKQLTEKDCREWKPSAIVPHDHNLEMCYEIYHACSKPVTWKGTHCTLIKKPMMMMMRRIYVFWFCIHKLYFITI